MSQDCPHCGLLNPPTAARCDCGYDFGTGKMSRTYLVSEPIPKKAKAAGLGLAGAVLVYLLIRLVFTALGK